MADAIGNFIQTGAVTPVTARAVSATPQTQEAFSINTQSSNKVDVTPLSPRTVFDPLSGVMVMEFMDNAGELQAQFPTEASLAYLRQGLMADGRNQPTEEIAATKVDV